ncbi:MAG: cation:proton antiporter, partial [Longimicrobiales bacterium]
MTISFASLAATTPAFFVEVAILIVAGAAIAFIANRLGFVPIVGFLLAGVVIGPNALALVRDDALVDAAAEVGVVLLLFTIGIEFSIEKLGRIRRQILLGGSLQVALAVALTMGVVLLLGGTWRVGLFTGFLVALSSTAIVLKLLANSGRMQSDEGQVSLALLIFQDLAVVAMVLVVPILGGEDGSVAGIAWALVKAVILVLAVVLIARRIMPRALEAVARTCSPEIFLLTVIAICFGTAYLTSLAGVSLSLGAFLAGLIVSESAFAEHAIGEIMPLQILFSATFFVSVGMLLDPMFLFTNLPLVLGIVALVILIKAATTGASVLALGYRLPLAVSTGLLLAQVGEFSFVLERAGRDVGLYAGGSAEAGSQAFIAATVLLMAFTPVLARLGERLGAKVRQRERAAAGAVESAETTDRRFDDVADHVIVAGYGIAGRRLARVLDRSRVPFVITTLSPTGAEEAERDGYRVLRGDSSRMHTLVQVGAERARMLVNADDDPAMARRVTAVARSLNPALHIIVRTRYSSEIRPLEEAGANVVISEELESIVQLFGEVLRGYQVDPAEVEELEETIRSRGYRALDRGRAPEPVVDAAYEETAVSRYPIDTERVYELPATASSSGCGHLDATNPVTPSARGCEECLAIGDRWVHLRLCMTCGHVGCCNDSRNKHATKHHDATSHPIIRSLEPGEDW